MKYTRHFFIVWDFLKTHGTILVLSIGLSFALSLIIANLFVPNLFDRYAFKTTRSSDSTLKTLPPGDSSIPAVTPSTGDTTTNASNSTTGLKSTNSSSSTISRVTQVGTFVDTTRNDSGTNFTGVKKMCNNAVDLGPPRGGDDAPWIKLAILDGMAAGKSAFSLREGSYVALSKIEIGVGIKQLCIEGAGSNKTIFITPTRFSGTVFYFGDNILSSNNWGLTTLTNRTINSVSEGSNTVILGSDQSDIGTGDYVIWDLQQALNQNNLGLYHATEIVKVVAYDKATKKATLDQPLGRDFNSTPKIGDINQRLSKNITFAGIGLNGRTSSGNWIDGLVSTVLATDVRYDDLAVDGFLNGAIQINVCRYCQLTRLGVANPQSNGVGTGYYVLLEKSRFVNVQDSTIDGAYMVHMGTMNATFERNKGRVDAHGMGEKYISVKDCVGRSEITFGNDAWKKGDIGLVVNNCQISNAYFVGDSRDIVVNNSLIGTLILSGGRQGYAVGQTVFNNVTLDRFGGGGSSAIRVYNDNTVPHGAIVFNNSKLNDFTQYWTRLLTFSDPYFVNMEFYGCEFETPNNPRATRPLFNIGPLARATSIIVKNSVFKSIDTTAVDIGSDVTAGTYVFENNTFYTNKTGAVFMTNASTGTTVVNANNQVVKY